MEKLKGRLLYMWWFNLPWKLVTADGEIDLWPIINKFFTSLNGKRANHEQALDSYTLSADESSKLQFNYVQGQYVFLEKSEGFGMSNVQAYLDMTLCWLSGRLVEIEIEDGKQVRFVADASEEVFGVYFTDNNSCEVPSGAEKTVCKAGQHDCCIFLSVDEGSFYCEKFNSLLARMLLDRLAKGNVRASRIIGNCALLGRKEREATVV